nr:hypothetical protein [uncultured Bacteroides sp.]
MNEIERKIARREFLLSRHNTITNRLDEITDRLFDDNVPVREFENLKTEHDNLNVEIVNVENELKYVFKINIK